MSATATDGLATPKLFLGRYWQAKGVLLLLVLLIVFSIGMNLDKFRMFIGFYKILTGHPDPDYCCYYWNDIAYQTTDWLMEKLQVFSYSHIASMRFRLFQPVLYTVFSSPLALYTVQVIMGIGYLYMVLDLAYQLLHDRVMAFLFAAGFVGLYAGTAFIIDVAGFGDAFGYTMLMAALYFRNPFLIGLAIFLGGWVDERAIVNVPLVMTYHLLAPYRTNRPANFDSFGDFRPTKQVLGALVGCLVYLTIRLYLIQRYQLSSPTGGYSVFFLVPTAIKTIGVRFWAGFEGFWLLFAAMLLLLWQNRQYWLFCILGGLTFITVFTVLMQGDYTRTISYGFPILFIALVVVSERMSRRDLFWVLVGIVITSTLLFPVLY